MIDPDTPQDLIVFNAQLYDPLKGMLDSTALRVSGGKLVRLGDDHEILTFRNPHTLVIDAHGRVLLPAFTDAHTHFFEYVKRRQQVDLSNCHSLRESLNLIRKRVNESPPGSWITGGGWNRNLWGENDYPTRHQLDEISTDHFIVLDSKDWHVSWVNTPVLEIAGIDRNKPYAGARHLAVHPKTGEFTGVLEENVRLAVYDMMPEWTYDRLRKDYQQVLQEFYRFGFSAIHSVETPREFRIAQEARRRGELGLRTFWYLPVKYLKMAHQLSIQQNLGDDFLQIAGVKIFVDGAFGSQTAELLENYQNLDHSGVENMTEAELESLAAQAIQAKLSCAIHAIGDRAIRKTLRVLGKFHELSKESGLRHRIEHVQMVQPQDIPLFFKYDIYASVQPIHLAHDVQIIRKYLGDRGKYTYPFKSLIDNQASLVFGSDIPIEDFNPWQAIYTAMERRYLLTPSEPSFFPEQKLDLATCIRAYSVNASTAVGMENTFGRLLPGMKADFFMPDRNIFEVSTEELKETISLLTVVNGSIVHNELKN